MNRHHGLINQYNKDSEKHDRPWTLYEMLVHKNSTWERFSDRNSAGHILFLENNEYRRHKHADYMIAYHNKTPIYKIDADGSHVLQQFPTWREDEEYFCDFDEVFSGLPIVECVLGMPLTNKGKSVLNSPVWNPVDGNDYGYEGEIVLKHENGSFCLAHSNWIGKNETTSPRSRKKNIAYITTRDAMGYIEWLPLENK